MIKYPALQVHQLTVNYDKTPVLWDISLEIPEGRLVGIIGPNGAGKSTFIKTALGLVTPLSGKFLFYGQPLKEVRRRIAYVPQRSSVDWDFPITVRNLVLMGRYGRLGLLKRPRKADWVATDLSLESVGMESYAERQISQLSGGQQQRVFIARALVQDADIYFLDEPLAGVDKASEQAIIEIIKRLRDKGKTVFVVHHDLNSAESFFDWAILLNMRLVACGPMGEVFTQQLLDTTYGTNTSLFDKALKISQMKTSGIGV